MILTLTLEVSCTITTLFGLCLIVVLSIFLCKRNTYIESQMDTDTDAALVKYRIVAIFFSKSLNLIGSIFLWQRNSDIDIQISTDTDADIGSVLHHHYIVQIVFDCSFI